MARFLVWLVLGGLALGVGGVVFAVAEDNGGPVYVTGAQPITEEQLRQRMQSDGYSNIQIVREGRYFYASGSKAGATNSIAVDSETGRLRQDGNDGEDDD